MNALLLPLSAHRGPLAIGIGLVLLTVGISTNNLGALTGFGMIAIGATWAIARRQPVVVWLHFCVYLTLYGLFAGAVLTRIELADAALWRVLLRLDFAASFILMVGVCCVSLPVILGEE